MDRLKLIIVTALMMVVSSALAKDVSYKYKIDLFFGIKESCTHENQSELSQVRFTVDKADLSSRKTFIPGAIRLSACVITGSLIKEHFQLPLPHFLFAKEAPLQGTFPLDGHKNFSKVTITEVRQGTYQLKYFEKSGKAWRHIDSIEITKNKKGTHPEKIKFDVTSKNQTIEARLRLIEEK